MNNQSPDLAITAGTLRAGLVARVARGKIALGLAAVLCGSVVVLGLGMATGAGIALSLPLSILVPGELAAIAPDLLATNGLAIP